MSRTLTVLSLPAFLIFSGCHNQTTHQTPSKAEVTGFERSSEWLWSESVQFSEYHDRMQIYLEDGRKFQVALDQPDSEGLKWSEVNQWKQGRPLRIAFSPASGPTLIDVESFSRLPIIGGFDSAQSPHPLDRLLRQNLENSRDTISIEETYVLNTQLWETEIDRIYDVAAEHIRVREFVKKAQVSWRLFRENQIKAAAELHNLPPGTMWQIRQTEFVHEFTRSHALQLLALLEPLVLAQAKSSEDDQQSIPSASSTPNESDYASSDTFHGKPAAVDLGSAPEARNFRTELANASKKPADFASFYVAASWGCGSPCQQWALIDLRDGKVYFAPFKTSLGGTYSINSRLFVADPSKAIAELRKETATSDFPLQTSYWEWRETEKKFYKIE
jgi:hypothetical protein